MAMSQLERVLRAKSSVWMKLSDAANIPYKESDVVISNGFITIKKFARMENELAKKIIAISQKKTPKIDEKIIDALIDKFEVEENEGRKLHFHQRRAVHMVINYNMSVLTGGPGTGKTTVLSAIAYCLRALKPKISICYVAPTGKAARRVTESTGEDATTVHKKMGLTGEEDQDPIPFLEDVLFCDESSMLDLFTAYNSFRLFGENSKCVLVGDVQQLPSVGVGAILRDVINSKVIPVTKLTKTFRQDNSSKLFENIERVKEGNPNLVEGSDFHLFPQVNVSDMDMAKAITLDYVDCVNRLGIENVCLLIPYRKPSNKTVLTSMQMNDFIQPYINSSKKRFGHYNSLTDNDKAKGMKPHMTVFREGDLVMQLENKDEICNGEIGKVIDVNERGIQVKFEYATVSYTDADMEQLALAYSMSIHKSQGSEYKCVLMALMDVHSTMLNRNLLYTGITRAKKECRLYYQPKALEIACKTIADSERVSLLPQKLNALALNAAA